jgi:hypothetical protein
MKKLIILIFCLLFVLPAAADNDDHHTADNNTSKATSSFTEAELPSNYQHFKHRVLNQNAKGPVIPAANYRGGDDYTMLYVAGGTLVVTAGFMFLNGKNDYTGDFMDEANTGILVGGSFSAIVFTTKYFIDKYRN